MNESIKQPIINDGHYFQSQNMVAPEQSTNIWIFSANVMDNTEKYLILIQFFGIMQLLYGSFFLPY